MNPGSAVLQTGDLHAVLAGWLVQRDGCSPSEAVQRHGIDEVLAVCEREGVVSLIHARLAEMATSRPVTPDLLESLAARARMCAARSLLCVSEARRIQQALDAAGIPAIWLKGIALGQWLYPSAHLRDIADIDLLLPDHATTLRAAEVLAPLGYALPNPHIAGDLVVYELLAWSERAQLELDLHWELSNHVLFAGRLPWLALHAASLPLPGLGVSARTLDAVDALLHACIHRALNALTARQDRLRWLYDIHLLVLSMDAGQWRRFKDSAIAIGIADPAFSALQACKERFVTPLPATMLTLLADAAQVEAVRTARLGSWLYLQRKAWGRLPSAGARFRWVRQLLLPDAAHLRVRYGGNSAGIARLVVRRLRDGWRRWRGYGGM